MAQKVTETVQNTEKGMETVGGIDKEKIFGDALRADLDDREIGGRSSLDYGGFDPDADDPENIEENADELSEMQNTGVFVGREKFISKTKHQKYWGYFVKGILRGHEMRVSLMAPDIGGYQLLDLVFNGEEKVELWRKPYTLKDEDGNVTAKGFTFHAVSFDEDGTVYVAQVKPSQKSDKAVLEKIVERSLAFRG